MGLVEEGGRYADVGMGKMSVVEQKDGEDTEKGTTQQKEDGGR